MGGLAFGIGADSQMPAHGRQAWGRNDIEREYRKKALSCQVKHMLGKLTGRFRRKKEAEAFVEEVLEGNPFLPRLRGILEEVLALYQMDYRTFCPLLLDTDTPPESMLDEDDVGLVLEQISKDLNFLKVATTRPAYFEAYIERMYEDTGLVVQVEGREEVSLAGVNAILDMEQKGDCHYRLIREGILYIPIYKRPWNAVGIGQNLDISVPIGYNTVIVKGK
ncbi:MAG: hypothetical protein HFH42_02405 [Lachnospiraceae bacterium]|jgi:hypothetical protein|nr:hypothetical protein [Lachnospiraceae bacterium]